MLFPAEYRSLASGTMNFIGRGFTAFSVILVEYTSRPIVFVLIMSAALIFALGGLITEANVPIEDSKNDDYVRDKSLANSR